jgi:alkylhydroperoxidase family enzyme
VARGAVHSARERPLEWTEAITLVSETHAPDDVRRVREQFSEDEFVHLTLAIVAINGWNRLNIAARTWLATTWPAASRSCTQQADPRARVRSVRL